MPCGWRLIALCGVFLLLVVWIACNDFNRFHGLLLACWIERCKGCNKSDLNVRTGVTISFPEFVYYMILPFFHFGTIVKPRIVR